jgi:predicted ester cyclase
MDELLATNFVFNYPFPGLAPNLEGYKQTIAMARGAFPDMRFTVEDVIAEADKVAVRWSGRSSHKGEYMGVAPTGKQVTMTGISILHIAGGKIAKEWAEMDNLGMMQQLGVIPPPGQPKK